MLSQLSGIPFSLWTQVGRHNELNHLTFPFGFLIRIILNSKISKIFGIILYISSVLFLGSCSKNDSREDHDTEEYSVIVSDYGDDKYSREVRIIDYSKAQKLKWIVFYQNEKSKEYFRVFPTEGIGSGTFVVRLKDPNNISYNCPIDIFFTTASGKTSSFSPDISFSHLQKSYPN